MSALVSLVSLRLLVDREGPNPRFNRRKPAGPDNPHTIPLPKGTIVKMSEEDATEILKIRVPVDPDHEPGSEPSETMPIAEPIAEPVAPAKAAKAAKA